MADPKDTRPDDIDPKRLQAIEVMGRGLATGIRDLVNETDALTGKRTGFVLILFDFAGRESTYASNAQRSDVIKFLRETASALEHGAVAPPGQPNHPANKPGKA